MSKPLCLVTLNGLYAKRVSGVLRDAVDVIWVRDVENASKFVDLVAASLAREFPGAQAVIDPDASTPSDKEGQADG